MTNKKIGAIAEETGFSAVRYYIKHFEHWFGVHPLEYRKKNIGKIISREIEAKYTRSSPTQIEDAIRKQVKGVYADYADKLKVKPVIIDVDIYDDYAEIENGSPVISEVMDRSVNSILAEPYRQLMNLEENVICSGENYVVTTRCKYPGALDSLSILVYNFDENAGKSLRKIVSEEDLLRIIKNYDDEIEFLIRCTGLSGKFRILRYRLERENLMRKVENALEPERVMNPRESFISRLSSEAAVSSGCYTSSDALSLRTTFKGIGAELILIDKK